MGHPKLPVLNDKQNKAIELILDGNLTFNKIAEECGVDRSVLYDWRKRNKFFITELNKRQQERTEFLKKQAYKKFEGMQDLALDVLKELLEGSKNDNVRMETAKEVLNRNIGKIPSKVEVKETTDQEEDNANIIDEIEAWDEEESK